MANRPNRNEDDLNKVRNAAIKKYGGEPTVEQWINDPASNNYSFETAFPEAATKTRTQRASAMLKSGLDVATILGGGVSLPATAVRGILAALNATRGAIIPSSKEEAEESVGSRIANAALLTLAPNAFVKGAGLAGKGIGKIKNSKFGRNYIDPTLNNISKYIHNVTDPALQGVNRLGHKISDPISYRINQWSNYRLNKFTKKDAQFLKDNPKFRLLRYDPTTGKFFYKNNRNVEFKVDHKLSLKLDKNWPDLRGDIVYDRGTGKIWYRDTPEIEFNVDKKTGILGLSSKTKNNKDIMYSLNGIDVPITKPDEILVVKNGFDIKKADKKILDQYNYIATKDNNGDVSIKYYRSNDKKLTTEIPGFAKISDKPRSYANEEELKNLGITRNMIEAAKGNVVLPDDVVRQVYRNNGLLMGKTSERTATVSNLEKAENSAKAYAEKVEQAKNKSPEYFVEQQKKARKWRNKENEPIETPQTKAVKDLKQKEQQIKKDIELENLSKKYKDMRANAGGGNEGELAVVQDALKTAERKAVVEGAKRKGAEALKQRIISNMEQRLKQYQDAVDFSKSNRFNQDIRNIVENDLNFLKNERQASAKAKIQSEVGKEKNRIDNINANEERIRNSTLVQDNSKGKLNPNKRNPYIMTERLPFGGEKLSKGDGLASRFINNLKKRIPTGTYVNGALLAPEYLTSEAQAAILPDYIINNSNNSSNISTNTPIQEFRATANNTPINTSSQIDTPIQEFRARANNVPINVSSQEFRGRANNIPLSTSSQENVVYNPATNSYRGTVNQDNYIPLQNQTTTQQAPILSEIPEPTTLDDTPIATDVPTNTTTANQNPFTITSSLQSNVPADLNVPSSPIAINAPSITPASVASAVIAMNQNQQAQQPSGLAGTPQAQQVRPSNTVAPERLRQMVQAGYSRSSADAPWSVGIRNTGRSIAEDYNNPLNETWRGRVKGNRSDFKMYNTLEDGIRGNFGLLFRYQDRDKLNTLGSILTKWSGLKGDKLNNYVNTIASRAGIDPNAPIDLHDPVVGSKVFRSMAIQESPLGRNLNEADIARIGYGVDLQQLVNNQTVQSQQPQIQQPKPRGDKLHVMTEEERLRAQQQQQQQQQEPQQEDLMSLFYSQYPMNQSYIDQYANRPFSDYGNRNFINNMFNSINERNIWGNR